VFFVTFVLIGTMIVLNLFVGVIVSGMEEAQTEEARREEIRRFTHLQTPHEALQSRLRAVTLQLEEVQQALKSLTEQAKNPESLLPPPAEQSPAE
jgi:voltage-gated sodium channel